MPKMMREFGGGMGGEMSIGFASGGMGGASGASGTGLTTKVMD